MFWNGSWYISTIDNDKLRNFDYGVFPIPRLTKETSPYAPNIQPRGVGGATAVQVGAGLSYALRSLLEGTDQQIRDRVLGFW